MASGDTKTEALLNVLGNGGSIEGITGCCNTKTQNYIIDAINRIQNVENEVAEIINNPDVVDIVNTYADLQAYDTQHLGDKAVIRVLNDETHNGHSTYYRYDKSAGTWTYIGEDSGGGGSPQIIVLTSDNYNYPINSPTRIALWRLPDGIYTLQTSISVYAGDSFGTDYQMNRGDYAVITSDPLSSYKIVYITRCNGGKGTIYKTYDGNSAQVWFPPANVVDGLSSTSTGGALSANQGKVLNDKITPGSGSGAPTTSTVGTLGKIYIDTSTDTAYMCTKVDGSTYTWKQITA